MLTQPITTPITVEEAVLRILRREGMLTELRPCNSGGVVDVMCPDPGCFWDATGYIRETHQEPMTPLPVLGGAMRLSPFCPRPYNLPIWQVKIQEFRTALRLVKAGKGRFDAHGDRCRWADELRLGIAHRLWLTVDARFRAKRSAEREKWFTDQELEIFCTFHRKFTTSDGRVQQLTYLVDHKHDLLKHWPISRIMPLNDQRFIEAMDPTMLEYVLD